MALPWPGRCEAPAAPPSPPSLVHSGVTALCVCQLGSSLPFHTWSIHAQLLGAQLSALGAVRNQRTLVSTPRSLKTHEMSELALAT